MTTHDETCGGVIAPLRGLPWREMKLRLSRLRWEREFSYTAIRKAYLAKQIKGYIREWREAQK